MDNLQHNFLPLEGVKVVDFSRYLPGPFCSLNLSWLGADVTVIEQAPYGDPLRNMPPLASDGISFAYHSLRRYCSIELLDLADVEGLEHAVELACNADIVLESFRPGVTEARGFGPQKLRELNPRLIYLSLSGYGQTGPWSQTPGHDLNYEALSGILEQTGSLDTMVAPPIPIADLAGGSIAATAICAALFKREQYGVGAYIDISLTEAALSMQSMQLPWLYPHSLKRGEGMLNGALACYRPYKCSDGEWVAVAPIEPKFFVELLDVLGLSDVSEMHMDPSKQTELASLIQDAFLSATALEWEQRFGSNGGTACVVRVPNAKELYTHPQHVSRNAFTSSEHGLIPNSPYVFDNTRTRSDVSE